MSHQSSRRLRYSLLTGVVLGFLGGCSEDKTPATQAPVSPPPTAVMAPAAVDTARITHADAEPGNWLSHGRTYSEQRFSPLDRINAENAGTLGLAWYFDLDTDRGQESTPIIVDGRNIYDPAVMERTGFRYWGVGRGQNSK